MVAVSRSSGVVGCASSPSLPQYPRVGESDIVEGVGGFARFIDVRMID